VPSADPASAPADTILVGGAVHTCDPAQPWAQAVAVRDGRIVAVGTDGEMRARRGPRTEVLELAGRTLLPGFQDAHAHPVGGGMDRRRCDLTDLATGAAYLDAVRAYAAAHPDLPWIVGRGWAMPAFPGGIPTAGELDRVVPDRPVYLRNRDGHGAWVNSRALELAGIDRRTPDPADGRIERDERGNPVGTLQEGARDLVERLLPAVADQDREAGLLEAQAYMHRLGITAWQDANIGLDGGRYGNLDTYHRVQRRGALTMRVVGALWWDRHRGLEQLDELAAARQRTSGGRFQPTSVKIMQDGVLENFTAGVLEPYQDGHGGATDRRGLSFIDPEELAQVVPAVDRAGFQVHFHAIGERAVREALDAIACARRANGMNDRRPHIAHIQVVHPDDLPRFRQLGVVANAQPLWAVNEPQMVELTIPFLGAERSTWQYPFRSLVAGGAALAFGSDWPVSSCDPLWQVHVAVNRLPPVADRTHRPPAGSPEVFLPRERLDLTTALQAFTMGSARVNHLERDTGSVTVGKAADLVVLDRNLLQQPRLEIAEARVVLTLVDGRPVHVEEGAWR